MTIGEKIKELRKKEKLSQEELAEKLNVSRSAVAKWESNHGVPEIGNLKMISDFFSVTMDSLFDEKKETEDILSEGKDEIVLYMYSIVYIMRWRYASYKHYEF